MRGSNIERLRKRGFLDPQPRSLGVHRHDRALIIQIANRVFGDPAKAQDWLNRPRVQLGGRTPMQMLGTKTGARRVEELLAEIDDDKRLGIG